MNELKHNQNPSTLLFSSHTAFTLSALPYTGLSSNSIPSILPNNYDHPFFFWAAIRFFTVILPSFFILFCISAASFFFLMA